MSVFDITNLIDFSVFPLEKRIDFSETEKSRLKKTSIDFTLCDNNDQPIVCVEFDGLQDGFNVGEKYYSGLDNLESTIWRREITELKLRVARASLFPFFVVGYKYFTNISKNMKITIVDGIIGEVIAKRKTSEEVNSFSLSKLPISEEEFKQLPPSLQHEYIQNWLWDTEISMDLEHNPIVNLRAKLEYELSLHNFAVYPLAYPTFEPGDINGFTGMIMHGDKVIYHTNDLGNIEGEAWLPNFDMPGFSGFGLTEDIAALYAIEKIKTLRKKT